MTELKSKGWKIKDQEEFLLRLGDLYLNGYSLLEALELMSIHYEEKKQKDLKGAILELKNGYSIHKVLESLAFHQDVLSLLFFSQRHGNLGEALKYAGRMMERKRYYRQKLLTIIKYPIFLIFLVLIMLLFVQTVLLPQFNLLFQQMNIVLNDGITLFLVFASKIPLILLFTTILIFFAFLIAKIYGKKLSPSRRITILMRLPLVRTFLSLHYSHYFTQQLSSLLASGMTINDAISVFEQQTYQPYLQFRAVDFRKRLIEGESLEELVASERVFEKGLSVVIVHGQKNGRLAQELQDYSALLLNTLQNKAENLLGKIQPCLFLAVGSFIFLLYLCIFIPMFQILGGL